MSDADPRLRKPDLRVLVFSASPRRESLNTKLAHLAAHHARRLGAVVDLATIRDFEVPAYDPEVEARDGVPAGALELNRRLTGSDAFMIASPEYNASIPGLLKSLIDWTSRLRPQPFPERHGLLLSASPSMGGGRGGLQALRIPLEHLGARIFPPMFSLAMAHKAFAGDHLADEALERRFEENVRAFLDLAEAARNYPCLKRAWIEFLGDPPELPTDRVEAT